MMTWKSEIDQCFIDYTLLATFQFVYTEFKQLKIQTYDFLFIRCVELYVLKTILNLNNNINKKDTSSV